MTRKHIILLLFTISFASFAEIDDKILRIPRALSARSNTQPQAQAPFPSEIGNDLLTREQQLIFGLVVLNRRHSVFRGDGYAYYLRELLNVTGYSAEEAKAIIENYKNNPEKYLSVLEKIKENLTTAKAETTNYE